MIDSTHPFVKAVCKWAEKPRGTKEHCRRIDVLNSVSFKLGFVKGAITNIPESSISAAAKLITDAEPSSVPFLSEYL